MNTTRENETNAEQKKRHELHQQMLKEHRVNREGRNDRARSGNIRLNKKDAEMCGFKTIVAPKRAIYIL